MTSLTNPVTGHTATTDEGGVEFWQAAGYRLDEAKKAPVKKAPAKKATARKVK